MLILPSPGHTPEPLSRPNPRQLALDARRPDARPTRALDRDLSGARALELLARALGVAPAAAAGGGARRGGGGVNLHSVWAFVNVFFWQLRDLHHADSVAQTLALLDSDGVTSPFKRGVVEVSGACSLSLSPSRG